MRIIFFGFFVIGLTLLVSAQNVVEIYQDDSLSCYFKKLSKKNGFYYQIITFKDSLPDGLYYLYDVDKKKCKQKSKKVILSGQFVNGKKQGVFKQVKLLFNEKGYSTEMIHVCNYVEGKKHGVDEKYYIIKFRNVSFKSMIYEHEFNMDKKEGVWIEYTKGKPVEIIKYSQDIKQTVIR